MEKDILDLILKYSLQKKEVDKNFFELLIEIIVFNRGLKDYIKKVNYNSINSQTLAPCASYQYLTSSLFIDIEKVIKYSRDHSCVSKSLFTEYGASLLYYLNITQVVLHELEHSYQYKISEKLGFASLKDRILKQCTYYYRLFLKKGASENILCILLEQHQLYEKNYCFSPLERLANIESLSIILSVLESIEENISVLYEFESNKYKNMLLSGYSEAIDSGYSCPTEAYFLNLGEKDFYDSLNEQENLNDEETLSLGLPVKGRKLELFNE